MTEESRRHSFVDEHFELLRVLGRGGGGVVHEAWDRKRREKVALKMLHQRDAGALYRLKREFRALADLSHPNLVRLHELHASDEACYFTMELVFGRDLLRWACDARKDAILVAGEHGAADDPTGLDVSLPRAPDTEIGPPSEQVLESVRGEPPSAVRRGADAPRVLRIVPQLVAGVQALHAAGVVHRDVKPSNIIITDLERLVLLDFGIAAEVHDGRATSTDVNLLAGTPAYMAPEQADASIALTPAADWYSVGVVLFEALAGRLPYLSHGMQVLLDKQTQPAPRLESLGVEVPRELSELVADLLLRDPKRRPDGAATLARLGLDRASGSVRVAAMTRRATREIVGREAELVALRHALQTVGATPVIARVVGTAGVGKTALAQRFLEDAERSGCFVLSGRCHERESVRFKAFDSLMDGVTRRLLKMSPSEQRACLPPDLAALARVFPVLSRVPGVEATARRLGADEVMARRRAFLALRTLLTRLSAGRPVVLFIDDLQWTDADSLALLDELASEGDGAPLFLLLAHRPPDADADPFARFTDGAAPPLSLGPLPAEAAERLATELLGHEGAPARELAREASGNPMMMVELAHYLRASPGRASTMGFRLESVLAERFDELDDGARALVEVVAMAEGPIARGVATTAAELGAEVATRAEVHALDALLIRVVGDERFEPRSDRVRVVVSRVLGAEAMRSIHRRIATALETHGGEGTDGVLLHRVAAGEQAGALRAVLRAAEQAAEGLAFERAASLAALGLEILPTDAEERPALLRLRAGALADCGHGAEAADAFLLAANGAVGDRLELRRRAAEELLRAGYVDRGLDLAEEVLREVGLRLSRTPFGALVRLLFLRIVLALRGLRFTPRTQPLSPAVQQRLDVCYSIASGLGVVDVVRAAEFQTRAMLASLRAGEPTRICQSLATEACFVATQGSRSQARANEIAAELERLAARQSAPEMPGLVAAARFGAAYFNGRFLTATKRGLQCVEVLREHGRGAENWLYVSVHYFWLASLLQVGDLAEFRRRYPAALREARERGNLYFETNLSVGDTNVTHLLADRPAEARAVVDLAMGRWSRRAFQVQHWYEVHARAQIELYEGHPQSALSRIDQAWSSLRRALQLRVQLSRVKALHLRGRAALASALASDRGAARKTLLARADADSRALALEGPAWARAFGASLAAGTARARGDLDAARGELGAALAAYEEADMSLYAAFARGSLGHLTGGDSGRAMVTEAKRAIDRFELPRPDALSSLFLPGLPP